MENTRTSDRNLETVAWGALFIWWGITELVPGLPHGTGAIGIGVILLGLNLARSLNGIPTSGFTTTLGILALVLGGWNWQARSCVCRSSYPSLRSC